MRLSRFIACSASAVCVALAGCAHYSGQQSSAASASAGSTRAQTAGLRAQSGQTRQQVLDQLDTNHDGMISRAESEASPELAAIFVATDANSDGMLTAVEFAVVPITFDAGAATGGTSSMGSGIAGSAPGWWPVQTPSQANETQPGMLNAVSGRR
jgi:hypothetical protein